MNCKTVRTLIQDELDGSLPVEVSGSLRQHLRTCAGCAAEFGALKTIDLALADWPPSRAPKTLTDAVMFEIGRRTDTRRLIERIAVSLGVPVGLVSAGVGLRAILFELGAGPAAARVAASFSHAVNGIAKAPGLASPGAHGVILALAAVALSFLAVTALRVSKQHPVESIWSPRPRLAGRWRARF